MKKSDIGLIGLAVMGQNFVLNLASRNLQVSVYNRTAETTKEFMEQKAKNKSIVPTYELIDFVASLERPRKIIILVKAGAPVDLVIEQLLPMLEKDDIIIDSGNSFFKDTERRMNELTPKGIHYIGMGISGGEKGALLGPSLMPGGNINAVKKVLPLLEKTAAVAPTPCIAYMGKNGAGHFVKMVHNGIEYADMQLIAEIYNIAKQVYGLSNHEIQVLFERFDDTELSSYLIEITNKIFKHKDEGSSELLVDKILDAAEGKGTGKWTVQEAMNLGTPVSGIAAALQARYLSSFRNERTKLSKLYPKKTNTTKIDGEEVFHLLKGALLTGKILAYAEGMDMLARASKEYHFDLNLSEIAKVWRGGCIIRSTMLNHIAEAFAQNDQTNMIEHSYFKELMDQNLPALRKVLSQAILEGIPTAALSAALSYFDSITSPNLPANLTQAQRDFFGAHTYKRIDRQGIFHTEWEE